MYLQEEIAHCAAGVRWLTYLHSHACSAASHPAGTRTSLQLRCSSLPHNEHNKQLSAQAGSTTSTCTAKSQADGSGKQTAIPAARNTAPPTHVVSAEEYRTALSGAAAIDQSQNAAPVHANSGLSVQSQDAARNTATVHDWQEDAQQYATVEEWFHSLVQAHFKGSLKVGCSRAAVMLFIDTLLISKCFCWCLRSIVLTFVHLQVQRACLVCAWAVLPPTHMSQCTCALQPPFNATARAAAGFGPEWYFPLSAEVLK